MSWLLDVLVLVLFFGTVICYTKKGFVKTILGFGRTLIAAILSWMFGPKLGVFISEKIIGNKITQKVYNILISAFDNTAETFDLSLLFDHSTEGFDRLVERLGGDMSALEEKYGDMTAATREHLVDLSHQIAQPITIIIANLLGYLLVFFAVFLFFVLFSGVISKIFELPILKQINRFFGFLLGLAFGALNSVIFCVFGSYVLPFIAALTAAFVADDLIASTVLFKIIAQFKLF